MDYITPKRPDDWDLQLKEHEQEELENWMLEQREAAFRPELGLKRTRLKKRKTQMEMADIMQLSRRAYQLHETGKRPIPSDALIKLAAYFEIDMHELFTGERYPMTRTAKEKNAEFAISTFVDLMFAHQDKGMNIKEAKQIALHYLKFNQPGDDPHENDLDESIRAMTGNKYVRGGPEAMDQ